MYCYDLSIVSGLSVGSVYDYHFRLPRADKTGTMDTSGGNLPTNSSEEVSSGQGCGEECLNAQELEDFTFKGNKKMTIVNNSRLDRR